MRVAGRRPVKPVAMKACESRRRVLESCRAESRALQCPGRCRAPEYSQTRASTLSVEPQGLTWEAVRRSGWHRMQRRTVGDRLSSGSARSASRPSIADWLNVIRGERSERFNWMSDPLARVATASDREARQLRRGVAPAASPVHRATSAAETMRKDIGRELRRTPGYRPGVLTSHVLLARHRYGGKFPPRTFENATAQLLRRSGT